MNNQDLIEDLEKFGLTNAQARVYLSICKKKLCLIKDILIDSRVSSSKVYSIIGKLIDKNLVQITKHKLKKYYLALPIQNINFELEKEKKEIEEKQKQIENLGNIFNSFSNNNSSTKVETYEGIFGFKYCTNKILEILEKDDYLYILNFDCNFSFYSNLFFNIWHKKRIKRGIKFKAIYSLDSKSLGNKRKSLPLTEIKYQEVEEKKMFFCICKYFVGIVLLEPKPKVIVIYGKTISNFFISHFEETWKNLK